MSRRPNHRLAAAATLALPLVLAGCGRKLDPPPVEVLQRPSLLGAGTIVQIKSTTNEELSEIEVTISSGDRTMKHTELRLAGYETVEIGWKKLGGWEIPADAEIEVRAAGYLLPVRARLESERSDGSTADGRG